MKYSEETKEEYFAYIREYEAQCFWLWIEMAMAIFGEEPVKDYLEQKEKDESR